MRDAPLWVLLGLAADAVRKHGEDSLKAGRLLHEVARRMNNVEGL